MVLNLKGGGVVSSILCFSGGKDSTALLIRLLELNTPPDRILFADVGADAEFEETYAFIDKVEKTLSVKIERVQSERYTFDSYFYSPISRGARKGLLRGFPPTASPGCSYRRELKIRPLLTAQGTGNLIYLGFAADEKERATRSVYRSLHNQYAFPLVTWGMTEADCMTLCQSYDLVHPLYAYFSRLGCWQCPKQSLKSLRALYQHWPEKWAKLEQYQRDCAWNFQPKRSVFDLTKRFEQEGIRRNDNDEKAAAEMA